MTNDLNREVIDTACEAYAKATGYYTQFHRGLSSPSADKMREGMRAALATLSTLPADGALVEALKDLIDAVSNLHGGMGTVRMTLAVGPALEKAKAVLRAQTLAGRYEGKLWRVGSHYGIHVYEGETPVCTALTQEFAAQIVADHNNTNGKSQLEAPAGGDGEKPVAEEGFVVAPVEPTEDMIEAGDRARKEHTDFYLDGSEVVGSTAISAVYRAMLASRPTSEGE